MVQRTTLNKMAISKFWLDVFWEMVGVEGVLLAFQSLSTIKKRKSHSNFQLNEPFSKFLRQLFRYEGPCSKFTNLWIWNSQEEGHLTKRQYVHATNNTTITATFTTTTTSATSTTASIVTTCKAKSIEMEISKSKWKYSLSTGHISNVLAIANFNKLNLPGLDKMDVQLIKGIILLLLLVLPLLPYPNAFLRPEHNMHFTENKIDFKCFNFFDFNKLKLLKL
jgi:hypothetical protein